jgi:3-hydroxyisobutyrate dehydrogenase
MFVEAPTELTYRPGRGGSILELCSLPHVGDGSRLKLVLDDWLAVLVEGTAETLALSSALGLDPRLFVETVAGGSPASAYASNKANAMPEGDFTPVFPLRHAAKDAALAADADADAADKGGLGLPLTAAQLSRWQQAIALGHGADDVASAVTASSVTSDQEAYT